MPVKVRFGEGKAETLADVIAEFNATKVFLMVDEGIGTFNPAAQATIEKLSAHKNLTITTFEKPAG